MTGKRLVSDARWRSPRVRPGERCATTSEPWFAAKRCGPGLIQSGLTHGPRPASTPLAVARLLHLSGSALSEVLSRFPASGPGRQERRFLMKRTALLAAALMVVGLAACQDQPEIGPVIHRDGLVSDVKTDVVGNEYKEVILSGVAICDADERRHLRQHHPGHGGHRCRGRVQVQGRPDDRVGQNLRERRLPTRRPPGARRRRGQPALRQRRRPATGSTSGAGSPFTRTSNELVATRRLQARTSTASPEPSRTRTDATFCPDNVTWTGVRRFSPRVAACRLATALIAEIRPLSSTWSWRYEAADVVRLICGVEKRGLLSAVFVYLARRRRGPVAPASSVPRARGLCDASDVAHRQWPHPDRGTVRRRTLTR